MKKRTRTQLQEIASPKNGGISPQRMARADRDTSARNTKYSRKELEKFMLVFSERIAGDDDKLREALNTYQEWIQQNSEEGKSLDPSEVEGELIHVNPKAIIIEVTHKVTQLSEFGKEESEAKGKLYKALNSHLTLWRGIPLTERKSVFDGLCKFVWQKREGMKETNQELSAGRR